MTHAPVPSRRRGFTLVELLVVIGIIALLISILLPSLNRARESAKMISCLSNMRQLGTASQMFVNDHNGWIYKAWNNSGPKQDQTTPAINVRGDWGYLWPRWGWDFVLGDTYMSGDKGVFLCASDDSQILRGVKFDPGGAQYGGVPADYKNDPQMQESDNYPASYKYNSSNVPWPNDGAKLTAITETTQSILLSEGVPNDVHHVATWDGSEKAIIGQADFRNIPLKNRHLQDKLNYLFVDGHGETMKWEESWRQLGEPFQYKAFRMAIGGGGGVTTKAVYPTRWRTRYPTSGGVWNDVYLYKPDYVFPRDYTNVDPISPQP